MPNEETTPQAQNIPEPLNDYLRRYHELAEETHETGVTLSIGERCRRVAMDMFWDLPKIEELFLSQEAELTRLRGVLQLIIKEVNRANLEELDMYTKGFGSSLKVHCKNAISPSNP